jgi:transposase/uncharacterized coiled-coil protein SlyX
MRVENGSAFSGTIGWQPRLSDCMDATAPLPNDLATCQQMIRELLSTVAELRATIDKQQAHIHYLVRMTFGRRSERAIGSTLFDDHPPPVPASPVAERETKSAPATPRPGHGRRLRPKDLPREPVVIDLTEAEKACPCCGEQRVMIGRDVSERLDYRPACLFIRATERPTYICRRCEQRGEDIQAVQAPLPPEPIPRGTVAAGLLAHVLVSKWFDHLPLYRLEGILSRLGWDVSRSTLCDQMTACAGVLAPLYERMCQRVRESFALHTDDTPIPLLNPRRTAHAWVYVGDAAHPYTVFDLTDGRRQEFPARFLAGYRGFIQADGYAGYNALYAAGATHVGCWAHVRRNYFEAKESDTARAHEALARIRGLYTVEAAAKQQNQIGADLAAYRREHADPLMKSFADWLAEEVPRVLPKSKDRRGVDLQCEPVADANPLRRRRPADDGQRAGRAGDPAACGEPAQLAAHRRRRRVGKRCGAPQHRRVGQTPPSEPVDLRQTPSHRVTDPGLRCRPDEPVAGCMVAASGRCMSQ